MFCCAVVAFRIIDCVVFVCCLLCCLVVILCLYSANSVACEVYFFDILLFDGYCVLVCVLVCVICRFVWHGVCGCVCFAVLFIVFDWLFICFDVGIAFYGLVVVIGWVVCCLYYACFLTIRRAIVCCVAYIASCVLWYCCFVFIVIVLQLNCFLL